MKIEIDPTSYDEITELIHSDKSPVGIDAKKTHILILQQLQEINERMARIEKQMADNK